MRSPQRSTERRDLDTCVSRPEMEGRKRVRAGTPMYESKRSNYTPRMWKRMMSAHNWRGVFLAVDIERIPRTDED
jgi:hypothetical protein